MNLHFTYTKLKYKKVIQFFIFLLIYAFIVKYPTLNIYTHNIIPQINFKEVCIQINEFVHSPMGTRLIFNILSISLVYDAINEYNFYNNLVIINKDYKNMGIKDKFNLFIYDLNRLEVSNPFLYSNKTRELRE